MTGVPPVINGGGVVGQPQEAKPQKEYLRLKINNALDLLPLIGKEIKELDIPEEAIEYIGDHPFAVNYEGDFMGFPCEGILMAFSYDFTTQINSVTSITISCRQPTFMDCKAYLEKELGECYYSGSTPYAAVNGGMVTYFTYYKDGYKYHLYGASARSYYSIQITREEPKGAPQRQSTDICMGIGMGMLNVMQQINTAPVSNTATVAVDNRETWFCSACGAKNKGKFCTECGTPRGK